MRNGEAMQVDGMTHPILLRGLPWVSWESSKGKEVTESSIYTFKESTD